MTRDDLLSMKDVIGSARFAYAAMLVGAKCQESKEGLAHMRELARLEKVIDQELKGQS
jgi:hypothetical protein